MDSGQIRSQPNRRRSARPRRSRSGSGRHRSGAGRRRSGVRAAVRGGVTGGRRRDLATQRPNSAFPQRNPAGHAAEERRSPSPGGFERGACAGGFPGGRGSSSPSTRACRARRATPMTPRVQQQPAGAPSHPCTGHHSRISSATRFSGTLRSSSPGSCRAGGRKHFAGSKRWREVVAIDEEAAYNELDEEPEIPRCCVATFRLS